MWHWSPPVLSGRGMAHSLVEVLSVLREAPLSAAERKAGVRRAVEIALLGAAAPEPQSVAGGVAGTDQAIQRLELSVAAVSTATGRDVAGVSEAKRLLRGWGPEGVALAARLGKCSKVRNGCCHPDARLAQDIAACAAFLSDQPLAHGCDGRSAAGSDGDVPNVDAASGVGEGELP